MDRSYIYYPVAMQFITLLFLFLLVASLTGSTVNISVASGGFLVAGDDDRV